MQDRHYLPRQWQYHDWRQRHEEREQRRADLLEERRVRVIMASEWCSRCDARFIPDEAAAWTWAEAHVAEVPSALGYTQWYTAGSLCLPCLTVWMLACESTISALRASEPPAQLDLWQKWGE